MPESRPCPTCWLPVRRRGATCPICRAPLEEAPVEEPPRRPAREPEKDVMGLPLMLFVAGAVVVSLAIGALLVFGLAVALVQG